MANKPYEFTLAELTELQYYNEGSNESLGYEKYVVHAAQKKMLEYLIDIPDAAFQKLLKEFGIGENND